MSGLKESHETDQRKHLNDERKKHLRAKLYSRVGFALLLAMPIIFGGFKRQGIVAFDITDIVSVVMFGGIGLVLVVELVIEKI